MDSDWNYFFSSKRHQSAFQSRSDPYLGLEEMEGDDDDRAEYPCPFCTEEFDIVGLCCHIDEEHPVEAKNGECPICFARVGMDMVGHITVKHEQFKMQRRRRHRKGSSGSHSTLALLRKELREGHLQSFPGDSSYALSSNTAPDPLLSSFIYSLPVADTIKDAEPHSVDEGSSVKKSTDENVVESTESSLSEKDQKEKALRCEFVQQILLSTFLDDDS